MGLTLTPSFGLSFGLELDELKVRQAVDGAELLVSGKSASFAEGVAAKDVTATGAIASAARVTATGGVTTAGDLSVGKEAVITGLLTATGGLASPAGTM